MIVERGEIRGEPLRQHGDEVRAGFPGDTLDLPLHSYDNQNLANSIRNRSADNRCQPKDPIWPGRQPV